MEINIAHVPTELVGLVVSLSSYAGIDIAYHDDAISIVTTRGRLPAVEALLDSSKYIYAVEAFDQDDGNVLVIAYVGDASDQHDYSVEDVAAEPVEPITEVQRLIKVNNLGVRRVKMKCQPGFKYDGQTCVKITGTERLNKMRAIRHAIMTKRSEGESLKRRTLKKTRKALRFRKSMGLS